jgi:hypothetical protein
MAVTGAVAIYAFPPSEGSPYAPPRGPRGEDAPPRGPRGENVLSRAPRSQRQADAGGDATILEFPDKFSAQLDDDRAYRAASNARVRTLRPYSMAPPGAPTGAFLAQHIAQERLSEGLTLEPHAQVAAAYARSRALASGGGGTGIDLAI